MKIKDNIEYDRSTLWGKKGKERVSVQNSLIAEVPWATSMQCAVSLGIKNVLLYVKSYQELLSIEHM